MTFCRGKKRFDTPKSAQRCIDMAKDAAKRGFARRQERRSYRCDICKGWHVTSEAYAVRSA